MIEKSRIVYPSSPLSESGPSCYMSRCKSLYLTTYHCPRFRSERCYILCCMITYLYLLASNEWRVSDDFRSLEQVPAATFKFQEQLLYLGFSMCSAHMHLGLSDPIRVSPRYTRRYVSARSAVSIAVRDRCKCICSDSDGSANVALQQNGAFVIQSSAG